MADSTGFEKAEVVEGGLDKLVARLRGRAAFLSERGNIKDTELLSSAALNIDRITAENAELRETLKFVKPFFDGSRTAPNSVECLKRIRAALSRTGGAS